MGNFYILNYSRRHRYRHIKLSYNALIVPLIYYLISNCMNHALTECENIIFNEKAHFVTKFLLENDNYLIIYYAFHKLIDQINPPLFLEEKIFAFRLDVFCLNSHSSTFY